MDTPASVCHAIEFTSVMCHSNVTGHGGMCQEHCAVMEAALLEIGYVAYTRNSQIFLASHSSYTSICTHRTVYAEVPGDGTYVVEVGYFAPDFPVKLVEGVEQTSECGMTFVLKQAESDIWEISLKKPDGAVTPILRNHLTALTHEQLAESIAE
jgi:arylamine N-acetyltransferase